MTTVLVLPVKGDPDQASCDLALKANNRVRMISMG